MMHNMWAGMWAMVIGHGVFWLALLTLVVLGIVRLARELRHGSPGGAEDAEEIVRRRYASGEISDDEYHQRLAGLQA